MAFPSQMSNIIERSSLAQNSDFQALTSRSIYVLRQHKRVQFII